MADGTNSPGSSLDAENPAAAVAVSLNLPPFSALDADTWFLRVEVQFRINCTKDSRKADYILAALPTETFSKIAPFLRANPNVDYETLKKHLLQKFTPSTEARAAKIRALSAQPLGEQKATDAWTEFKALAYLEPPIDMLKELWLCRLPPSVRAALPKASTTDTDDLAIRAQELIESHAAATSQSVYHASSDGEEPANDDEGAAQATQGAYSRQPRSHRPLQPFRPFQAPQQKSKKYQYQPQFCFHHTTFGANARKCEKGWKWPKNA